jgi:hypothetical protein
MTESRPSSSSPRVGQRRLAQPATEGMPCRLALLHGLAVAAALALPAAVQARPFHSTGFPAFANEGLYPEATSCRYSLLQSKQASWRGRTITLKYFYNGRCGSFARIDNAPGDCKAYLDRTPDRDTVGGWAFVGETVDPGISFAYTQVGNNLSGRLSRAALVCGSGIVVARTNWF